VYFNAKALKRRWERKTFRTERRYWHS